MQRGVNLLLAELARRLHAPAGEDLVGVVAVVVMVVLVPLVVMVAVLAVLMLMIVVMVAALMVVVVMVLVMVMVMVVAAAALLIVIFPPRRPGGSSSALRVSSRSMAARSCAPSSSSQGVVTMTALWLCSRSMSTAGGELALAHALGAAEHDGTRVSPPGLHQNSPKFFMYILRGWRPRRW